MFAFLETRFFGNLEALFLAQRRPPVGKPGFLGETLKVEENL
jgi:hypothetical protein